MVVICVVCKKRCVKRTSCTAKNPGRHFYKCPSRENDACMRWIGWVDEMKPRRGQKPVYRCARCDKVIDVRHEVENHQRRHHDVTDNATALMGKEIERELVEAMRYDKYTCEACLFYE